MQTLYIHVEFFSGNRILVGCSRHSVGKTECDGKIKSTIVAAEKKGRKVWLGLKKERGFSCFTSSPL